PNASPIAPSIARLFILLFPFLEYVFDDSLHSEFYQNSHPYCIGKMNGNDTPSVHGRTFVFPPLVLFGYIPRTKGGSLRP
ncbi:hypothetical protein P9857_14730, partial [Anoxybacillus geothermalis]|nr:hypothetical protein [Anoxybacillus geothermalis]